MWQIMLEEKADSRVLFATHDGATFQSQAMPFGINTAPATFQKMMPPSMTLKGLENFSTVYLDDVIIFSHNYWIHLHHLR